jgi:hypothetical protein
MAHAAKFLPLTQYLARVPAIGATNVLSSRESEHGWWVKLVIDIDHPLAWSVVQELGHVLNYLALEERLPTVFMPVSPPPYMNGGPREFLSWVIEGEPTIDPDKVAEWLEGRLPRPVEDEANWAIDEDDDD